MKMMARNTAVLCLFFQCIALQAASFNCGADLKKVEKMICDDALLSDFDTELSTLYKQAYEKSMDKSEFKDSQQRWLKIRNACVDSACVGNQYIFRLSKLRKLAAINPNRRVFEVINTSKKFPNKYSSELVDVKACQIMADNINAVDIHGVNWSCDFPVSSMVRGINFPNWIELFGESKKEALGRDGNEKVFSFSFDVRNFGETRVYSLVYEDYLCGEREGLGRRSRAWFKSQTPPSAEVDIPNRDSLRVSDIDFIKIGGDIYLIEYGGRSSVPDSFFVSRLAGVGGQLVSELVCKIELKDEV